MRILPYNRSEAAAYATTWALSRNKAYYDFSDLGGDCTNFASQCVFAGGKVMNYTKTFGWYYISLADRAPAWTGVEPFFNFFTKNTAGAGPFGREAPFWQALPGDVFQLSFVPERFGHSLVVAEILGGSFASPAAFDPRRVLICTHTADAKLRPLSTYTYRAMRLLHMEGVRRW